MVRFVVRTNSFKGEYFYGFENGICKWFGCDCWFELFAASFAGVTGGDRYLEEIRLPSRLVAAIADTLGWT